MEQFHRSSFFSKNLHAFSTAISDVRMLFCNRLRMEVQVCGYVWTGKNDVMWLRVDAETFENGKKSLRFQINPETAYDMITAFRQSRHKISPSDRVHCHAPNKSILSQRKTSYEGKAHVLSVCGIRLTKLLQQ